MTKTGKNNLSDILEKFWRKISKHNISVEDDDGFLWKFALWEFDVELFLELANVPDSNYSAFEQVPEKIDPRGIQKIFRCPVVIVI
jgi:hypothetical protein